MEWAPVGQCACIVQWRCGFWHFAWQQPLCAKVMIYIRSSTSYFVTSSASWLWQELKDISYNNHNVGMWYTVCIHIRTSSEIYTTSYHWQFTTLLLMAIILLLCEHQIVMKLLLYNFPLSKWILREANFLKEKLVWLKLMGRSTVVCICRRIPSRKTWLPHSPYSKNTTFGNYLFWIFATKFGFKNVKLAQWTSIFNQKAQK